MSRFRWMGTLGTFALLATLGNTAANAQQIKTVFVIAMENHNWTQPANQFSGPIQQVYQNPNAPFINSLVDGSAYAVIDGTSVHISEHVAFATNYHNVLATPSGANPHIHPSEPNYLWAEAGTNFGVLNDNDPFKAVGGTNQNDDQHLSTYLTNSGKTWKSYQEDVDLAVDTNGGNDATTANPLACMYAPLQQLFADLDADAVADYNWISPNQYNDMHTSLTGGYQGLTGDAANIKQGDDFLKQIIPVIMASNAYKNHGAIVIWWDESEQDAAGDNPDDFNHTVGEIVISDRAHPNVGGRPYASPASLTHSSDLRTMQEIFRVGPYLRDALFADDLSDLFKPGAVPKKP